ncbi:hypothetical protein VTK56DRAFT_2026 [Thermocarpiscus australiensis]
MQEISVAIRAWLGGFLVVILNTQHVYSVQSDAIQVPLGLLTKEGEMGNLGKWLNLQIPVVEMQFRRHVSGPTATGTVIDCIVVQRHCVLLRYLMGDNLSTSKTAILIIVCREFPKANRRDTRRSFLRPRYIEIMLLRQFGALSEPRMALPDCRYGLPGETRSPG